MNTYQERMAKSKRKKSMKKSKHMKPPFEDYVPKPPFAGERPKGTLSDAPSLNLRVTGATPPLKSYSSKHTVAPAYNKGPYMVISENNIEDIGK